MAPLSADLPAGVPSVALATATPFRYTVRVCPWRTSAQYTQLPTLDAVACCITAWLCPLVRSSAYTPLGRMSSLTPVLLAYSVLLPDAPALRSVQPSTVQLGWVPSD